MREVAEEMDRILWGVLESCANSSIPRGDQGKGWDCPLSAPVAAWHGRSYQEMKVHLPARSGGLGLSSMVDLIPAAFCGGVQQSLPHFVGQRGLCKQLRGVLAGEGFSQLAAGAMWQQLLNSGCRTGQELRDSWQKLKVTGMQACQYLGRPLEGSLSHPVENMGDGGEDGSVRPGP